jgi:uncharacterized protein (UPF0332 family)
MIHAGLLVLLSKELVLTGKLERRYFDMLSEAKELRESRDDEPFSVGTAKERQAVLQDAKHSSLKSKERLGKNL